MKNLNGKQKIKSISKKIVSHMLIEENFDIEKNSKLSLFNLNKVHLVTQNNVVLLTCVCNLLLSLN